MWFGYTNKPSSGCTNDKYLMHNIYIESCHSSRHPPIQELREENIPFQHNFFMVMLYINLHLLVLPDDGLLVKPQHAAGGWKIHVLFDCYIYLFLVFKHNGTNMLVSVIYKTGHCTNIQDPTLDSVKYYKQKYTTFYNIIVTFLFHQVYCRLCPKCSRRYK